MTLDGWTVLGIIAGVVAMLAALMLNRKETPKWISLPLLFAAAIIAGIAAYQSVIQFDQKSNIPKFTPYDVASLNPEVANAVTQARLAEEKAGKASEQAVRASNQAFEVVSAMRTSPAFSDKPAIYKTDASHVNGILADDDNLNNLTYTGEATNSPVECLGCKITGVPNGYGNAEDEPSNGFITGFTFSGQWSDGKLLQGVVSNSSGSKYQCTYSGQFSGSDNMYAEGYGSLIDFYSIRYYGSFKRGRQDGFGVEQFSDGSRYEGAFFRGEREGFGAYWSNKGQAIGVGIWKHGQLPQNFNGDKFQEKHPTISPQSPSGPADEAPLTRVDQLWFCTPA